MKISLTNNRRKIAVVFLFLFTTTFLFANNQNDYIINNDNIIGERVVSKINEIGQELYNKTNTKVYALVDTTTENLSIQDYISLHTKDFKTPYILLLIITEDKIIDILNEPKELLEHFNKKAILSPYAIFGGTILPLLSDRKKDNDKYSAALLNGYADLTDQIAKSYNVELESSIGNANKNTLNFIRILVYGFLVAALIIYAIRRIKNKNAKK